MINKRLLIKNLLAHNDESSFYDKKRQLNLHSREGKAKFLKHICALSNSNPANNSYIVVGVEDHDNEIVGDDFEVWEGWDESKEILELDKIKEIEKTVNNIDKRYFTYDSLLTSALGHPKSESEQLSKVFLLL